MAKANNEFKETIMKERCFAVLKTRVSDNYLLIIKVVTASKDPEDLMKVFGLSNTSLGVTVQGLKEDLKYLKPTLRNLIPLVIPKASKKEINFNEVFALDSVYSIVESDINQHLYDNDYKYLCKEDIESILDAKKIDHSTYVYTEIVIKNEYELDEITHALPEGYDKYPEIVTSRMINKPIYKMMKGTHVKEIYKALKLGYHVILVGEPGTGKTTDVAILGSLYEIPVLNALAHKDFTNEDILGAQATNASGKIAFIPANGGISVEHSGIYFVDEATASSCIASTLNALADDTSVIQLPNGELIKKHKDFRLILSYNPGANETFMLPESTTSRFVVIYYDQITEEQFIDRITFNCGGFNNSKFLKELYKTFINTSEYCKSCNYSISINSRCFERFLNSILLDDKISLEEWHKEFSNNVFSSVAYARENIDSSQIKDLDKVAEPWVDKLYEIYHEADTTSDDSSAGGFKIDTAVVEDMDAVEDYLDDLLGESSIGV